MSQNKGTDVLVVEDDELFAEVLNISLTHHGYHSVRASTGEAALELAYKTPPKAVILDLKLPGQSGYLVAEKLLSLDPPPKIIVLTALPRGYADRMCQFLGVESVHHKPTCIRSVMEEIGMHIRPGQRTAA